MVLVLAATQGNHLDTVRANAESIRGDVTTRRVSMGFTLCPGGRSLSWGKARVKTTGLVLGKLAGMVMASFRSVARLRSRIMIGRL